MVHPYIVNTINEAVLIVAGLAGYFFMPSKPVIALIAPAFGLLLLACTYHLRRHHRFVFALAISLGFFDTNFSHQMACNVGIFPRCRRWGVQINLNTTNA